MRQVLHLLFVHPATRDVLASWYQSRWVLPVMTLRDRVRAGPSVQRWASERGIDADVVGQWLGRVSPAQTDWLVVCRVERRSAPVDPQLVWTELHALAKHSPLIEYQAWSVARVGPDVQVGGPFGNLEWHIHVRDWIERVAGSLCSPITPYRIGASEVVLSATTSSGRVYFKGLSTGRQHELHLTRMIECRAPQSVARTIAVEAREGDGVWWLTESCRGRPCAGASEVAVALATLQRQLGGPGETILPRLDLAAVRCWAHAMLANDPESTMVDEAFSAIARARYPSTWIPMDLDPSNVLVDDDRSVRLIDLDDSYFGPAPLAMCVYATRSRAPSLYGVYENAWTGAMRPDWRVFEIVATVIEAWLGLRRLRRIAASGELTVDDTFAVGRVHARFVRVLHGR